MNTKWLISFGVGVLWSLGGLVQADNTPASSHPRPIPNLFGMLATAKISLDDAIKTAEQTVAGKLVKAEADSTSSPQSYRITLADVGTRTMTYVKVDANTGKVLGTRTYRAGRHAPKVHSKPTFGASIHSNSTKASTPATSTTDTTVNPVAKP